MTRSPATLTLLVAVLLAAMPASAQLPGGGSGSLGEEEHAEHAGPEANLAREIDGVRPVAGTKLPSNARIYFASRVANVEVTIDMKGEILDGAPTPLVDGCVSCVYEVALPPPPGEPSVRVFTDRNEEVYSYELDQDFVDTEAPVVADAPSLSFRRQTGYDVLGQPFVDRVIVQAAVRPPDNADGVTALIAYAGRPGEALVPWAAKLWTPGCHPCTIDLVAPPGADTLDDGETCVRVIAVDWAGNRGAVGDPTCLEVPAPSPGLPIVGCSQAPTGALAGLAALLLGLAGARRRRR